MLFFKSQIDKDRKENILSQVSLALQNFSKTGEDIIEAYEIAQLENHCLDYYWKAAKIYSTVFIWGMYLDIKDIIRTYHQYDLNEQLENNTITPKKAVLEILTTWTGTKDIHSVKYLFIRNLFGLSAKDNDEAEMMINTFIDTLKKDIDLELVGTAVKVESSLSSTPRI